MKVRIKSTGEIKKVADYDMVTLDTCDSYGTPEQVSLEDVELIQESSDNTNWEQVRIQAAVSTMHALRSNVGYNSFGHEEIAELAVRYTDALIEELKKNKV